MEPGEEVEVEPRDGKDWVVCVLLDRHKEICGGVPDKGEVVVARMKRLKESGRGGEQRDVLDIRIVFLGCMLVKW